MGARVRTFDWTKTSLGPPERWTQGLRTAVRLMLNTNHPTFLFWGPDAVCLYNDAYSLSLGPEKHPELFGLPGRLGWEEHWDEIEPQLATVMRGEGATWHEDHLIPAFRNGRHEEVYWTYSYSPVDDPEAPTGVGGALVVCNETTARVVTERRLRFLVTLSDRLRDLADPNALLFEASAMLGRKLRVDCVCHAEVDDTGARFKIEQEWMSGNGVTMAGTHKLSALGTRLLAELRAGRVIAADAVEASAQVDKRARATWRKRGVGSFVIAPLVHEGRLTGMLFVLERARRSWTQSDQILISEVAARTDAALGAARSLREVAANERLLRAIGESSRELIFAKDRKMRILYANPATLAAMGKSLEDVLGRSVEEFHDDPTQIAAIVANDREVLKSGQAVRASEAFTGPDGRTREYEGTKAPMRGEDGSVLGLVGVSTEVTERNRAQRHLRLMVDELNHRVKNTLAIVQGIAYQTFRDQGIAETARIAFEERLGALATAHGLLTRENWDSVDLGDLAREACDGHAGFERIHIAGPLLRLAPKVAVTIAMALHELCTNATKYGALSVGNGRIDFTWSVLAAEGESKRGRDKRCLRLEWRESGGPRVVAPRRRGFGSRMIERALAAELGGEVRLDFAPAGLVCTIEAPLARAVAE